MRVTQVLVKFELLNNEAQNACTFSSSGNKPFGDLSRLNEQEKPQYPFMTLELNEGILDGSLLEFNASEQKTTAFMSTSVSGENCKFQNVWVEGTLDKPYKFIGITLDFGLYYPKKVTVEYYQKNIKLNHKTIDNIDNTWVYVDMRANDIDKVRVVFDESWAPFEYAWLQEFLFGNVIEWTTNDVISGKLQEETDIISKVIPNDTFSLVIYSKRDEFNVINPTGAYAYLLPNQRFKIREFVHDLDHDTGNVKSTREINLGSFYLDSWESMFNKQIKFNLVSPLAQLDKTKYKKSPMYKGTSADNAYDALKAVFSDCEYDNYLLDEELKNVFLTGYIPVCTHK